MADQSSNLLSSTPEASAADAQSRGETSAVVSLRQPLPPGPGEGIDFLIGPRVFRAVSVQAYRREVGDPIYRPLRIYTHDPSASRLEGAVALINVPYESLERGPSGSFFRVDNYDGWQNLRYQKADLNAPGVLIRDGYDPSPSNPQFHQQMVYAVCSTVYSAFTTALGRHIAWGFDRSGNGGDPEPSQLVLKPHAGNEKNAYYDKDKGEICFGYYRAPETVGGRNLPGGFVFTCLSHDIIAHEVTHALLDGLRAHFVVPSGPDVLAFHEGFADIIAIFQHFSYEEVLRTAIRKSRGNLEQAELLTDIARQFGHTTGSAKPLRSAIDKGVGATGKPREYDANLEAHDLGGVLVTAVFDAFLTVYRRKTEKYIRLATNGSGRLSEGELPVDLQDMLASEASKLANQFLMICIRAIDYCPPVGLEFGEFLRAVITADCDLVPDDPWGYREAWIDAFRRHKIYPRDVHNLSEDALLWRSPRKRIPETEKLSFGELRFCGDPGRPAGAEELQRQACELGKIISTPEFSQEFGVTFPGDPELGQDTVDLPCVESIRSSRRAGPDGQIVFDLIAEVTQRRHVFGPDGKEFDFYGGSTVILGPQGEIRYVISKNVMSQDRINRQREFMASQAGQRFWNEKSGRWAVRPQLFQLIEER